MLISVRTRLCERTPRDLLGVEALTAALGGEALEIDGGPDRRPEGWSAVLEACRPPLERAGDEVDAALRRGDRPLTVASDCSVAIATLPAVHRALPGARALARGRRPRPGHHRRRYGRGAVAERRRAARRARRVLASRPRRPGSVGLCDDLADLLRLLW